MTSSQPFDEEVTNARMRDALKRKTSATNLGAPT